MSSLSIKAILTINLEGCVSHRDINSIEIPYSYELGKAKLVKTGSIKHKNLLNSEAKQRIKISQIAYEFMTNECPKDVKPAIWKTLSKELRVKHHAEKIAHDLHGSLETIEIF